MPLNLGMQMPQRPQKTMQQSPPRFGQNRNMFGSLFNRPQQQPGINPAFNQMQKPGIGLSGIQPPPFQSLPGRPIPMPKMIGDMPAVQGNIPPQKSGFMDRFKQPDFWNSMAKTFGPEGLGGKEQIGTGGNIFQRQDPFMAPRQLSQRLTDWSSF